MDEKIDRSDDAPTRWQVAVDSLLRLVRAYEENGIQATFTLVAFATSATVNPAFSGITGSDFLALYEELGGDDAARDTLASLIKQDNTSGVVHDVDGLGIGGETNYNLATQLLMQELDKAMNDPARADIEKSVFFMSDGVSTSGNPTAWYEYLRQHPDDFNTYAIGMGSAVTDAAKNMLVEVTGGKDENFVMVDDFSDLGDVLVSFIEPVSGNILENLGSADANTLKSIWILAVADANDQSSQQDVMQNGREYTFPADGSPLEISLGDPQNPVKMTIQPDGSYKVTSGNVSNDFPYRIVLEIDDADGDTVTTQAITLILKDAEPKAYDNIGVYDTFDGAQNNLSSDQGGFTGSNTAGWLLTNGRFEVKAGGETVPESGLPSNLLGSHYLHLASRTGAESASLYMDHLGNRMYLWDIAESLGFGPNELLNMGPGIAQRYSMASTSVSATEGQISFGWTARGDAGDVSFYLLVDSKGQIDRSGVLSRLDVSGTDSGEATIDIPLNNGDEEYRIVFSTFDGGYNGSSG